MEFLVRYLTFFLLLSVIDGCKWPQGLTFFLIYISDLPDDVICDITICADDTSLFLSVISHLICVSNLNWLLNLHLIYKTLWTGVRSGLLISVLGKLNWFCLTGVITMVLFMWKWKNLLIRCWCWPFLLNWIGALTLSQFLKLSPRKLELQFVLWSFFLLRLLCISINLQYAHVWNTVVTSGLLPLVATWNC